MPFGNFGACCTVTGLGCVGPAASLLTASVIICDADALPAVQAKLGTRPYHNQGFYGLRPNENLIMLVEQSLWTRYENAQKDAAVTP